MEEHAIEENNAVDIVPFRPKKEIILLPSCLCSFAGPLSVLQQSTARTMEALYLYTRSRMAESIVFPVPVH